MSDAPFSSPEISLSVSVSADPLVSRHFVSAGSDPLSGLEFESRNSVLKGVDGVGTDKGEVVAPVGWSANASDMLCQKYLRRRGVPDQFSSVDEGYGAFDRRVPAAGATMGREMDLRQCVHRMAGGWAYWGLRSGLLSAEEAAALYDESSWLLSRQAFAPNSPQWFNTGLHWAYGIGGPSEGHYHVDPATNEVVETEIAYERPQPQACFIQSVSDDLVNPGGIMDLFVREARLFKYGSGTGTNYSNVRAKDEPLTGGGGSSGLMSWLRIGDRSAAGIQSGGTTRRAAKMVVLDVDHPEIEDYVIWKAVEERKVAALVTGSRVNRRVCDRIAKAVNSFQSANCVDRDDRYLPGKNAELRKALKEGRSLGVPDRMMVRAIESIRNGLVFEPEVYDLDWQGGAYETVAGQQSNNSVSVPHAFMEAVIGDKDWSLIERTTGKVRKTVSAAGLYGSICESAWACADPGLQFVDTMNDWHTCLADGLIRSTNPCAEYVFLDDTACNLGSLNLVSFLRPDGTFDLVGFEAAVRCTTTVLEISVAMATLPSKKIARGTFDYRTLGLGYANLGALLMRMGIPYDSDEGRRIGAALTSFMTATAYDQSGRMAARVGSFARWSANQGPMTRVLENHRKLAHGLEADVKIQPPRIDLSVQDRAAPLLDAAALMWDQAVSHGRSGVGYRNAQVTVIAPTGTIAIVMDCDTTGPEPDFALVKYKTLAGGGYMKMTNQSVSPALRSLGYTEEQILLVDRWVGGHGRLRDQDRAMLLEGGLSEAAVGRIEVSLSSALHLRMALLPDVIGRDELGRLGIDPKDDVARSLGFDDARLAEATDWSCGRQTVEGCPVIRPEDLAVFDCANRCGPHSTRFIRPEGHLLMLAALQPFLSGASSKTVNLPSTATVEDVRRTYTEGWKLGVKCLALYVDASKFSQPLSSMLAEKVFGDLAEVDAPVDSAEHARVVETIVERVVEKRRVVIRYLSERRRLPDLRLGYTQRVTIGNHKMFLRTGEYPDGTLGEIFIDSHRDGTSFKSMMGAFAIAVSIGLQHGVPLERFVDLFTLTKFEPNGIVSGDGRIFMCTSMLDWIFRHLAVSYLGRDDLAMAPAESSYDPSTIGAGEPSWDSERMLLASTSVVDATPPDLTTDEVLIAQSEIRFRQIDESLPHRRPAAAAPPIYVHGGGTFSGEMCDSCGNYSLRLTGRCTQCMTPGCPAAVSSACG